MSDTNDDIDDALATQVDELLERAETGVETLASDSATGEEVADALDELEDVADEAEDLLATVDLPELLSAIDWREVPEAIEAGDLSEALAEDDTSESVTIRQLLQLVDLSELWESVDTRSFWREKREFDEELSDVIDEEDEGSGVDADDGGIVSANGSDPESDAGHDYDPESVENAVQTEVSDAVGSFRQELLAAHERLAEMRAANEDRFGERRRNRSRNPTAVSTLPTGRSGRGGAELTSTVPEETRHSTAPNRKRIYGSRFDSMEDDDE